jgi:hypothetical protein
VRDGDKRSITVQDGDAQGKHVIIVDDLVQTGKEIHNRSILIQTQKKGAIVLKQGRRGDSNRVFTLLGQSGGVIVPLCSRPGREPDAHALLGYHRSTHPALGEAID